MPALLERMAASPRAEVRQLAAQQLRKCITRFWRRLRPQVRLPARHLAPLCLPSRVQPAGTRQLVLQQLHKCIMRHPSLQVHPAGKQTGVLCLQTEHNLQPVLVFRMCGEAWAETQSGLLASRA